MLVIEHNKVQNYLEILFKNCRKTVIIRMRSNSHIWCFGSPKWGTLLHEQRDPSFRDPNLGPDPVGFF